MSQSIVPPATVEYPCSDGQPMAETPVHRRCMIYLLDALERRLRTGVRPSRLREREHVPVLRARQSAGGGGAGRLRGAGRAGSGPGHLPALGGVQGSGLRGGGDFAQHPARGPGGQTRGVCPAGSERVHPLRPESGVPEPALSAAFGCEGASTIPCWRGGRRRGRTCCKARFWGWSFETRGKSNCCAFTTRRPGKSSPRTESWRLVFASWKEATRGPAPRWSNSPYPAPATIGHSARGESRQGPMPLGAPDEPSKLEDRPSVGKGTLGPGGRAGPSLPSFPRRWEST